MKVAVSATSASLDEQADAHRRCQRQRRHGQDQRQARMAVVENGAGPAATDIRGLWERVKDAIA